MQSAAVRLRSSLPEPRPTLRGRLMRHGRGRRRYSTKADIFSAAISTVFLITGEEPYSQVQRRARLRGTSALRELTRRVQDPEVFSDGHYAIACRVCKQGYRMPLSSIKFVPQRARLPCSRPRAVVAHGSALLPDPRGGDQVSSDGSAVVEYVASQPTRAPVRERGS
jgi:hypothetical protein